MRSWYPFGAEYALHPRWSLLERWYVRMLGIVDLPGRLRARMVIRKVRELGPRLFLDLGVGTGCYCFYLSRNADARILGIDVDPRRIDDSLEIAHRLGRKNLEFRVGDGSDCLCAFGSAQFDVVLAIEVFQYLTNIRLALSETLRVLKPGGRLVGHVPCLGYLREFETILFDDSNIKRMLTEAGFHIEVLTPTLGGMAHKLCWFYDLISRSRILAALLFPLLLCLSWVCSIESASGRYRFFVARKPVHMKTLDVSPQRSKQG